jgi:hypothetical protein
LKFNNKNKMKKYAWIWIVIIIIFLTIVAFSIGQNSNNSAQSPVATVSNNSSQSQATPQQVTAPTVSNTPTPTVDYNSLCTQAAQQDANTNTQVSSKLSLPVWSYFVVSSHYVASQDSCYAILHGNGESKQSVGTVTLDSYEIDVENEPTDNNWNKLGDFDNFVEDAECTVQSASEVAGYGNPTSCNYYGATLGLYTQGFWSQQYPTGLARNMSYTDFESLVQTDMSLN